MLVCEGGRSLPRLRLQNGRDYDSDFKHGSPRQRLQCRTDCHASTIPAGDDAVAANVTVWTEAALLEALTRERTIAGYLTALLDELVPAQQAS